MFLEMMMMTLSLLWWWYFPWMSLKLLSSFLLLSLLLKVHLESFQWWLLLFVTFVVSLVWTICSSWPLFFCGVCVLLFGALLLCAVKSRRTFKKQFSSSFFIRFNRYEECSVSGIWYHWIIDIWQMIPIWQMWCLLFQRSVRHKRGTERQQQHRHTETHKRHPQRDLHYDSKYQDIINWLLIESNKSRANHGKIKKRKATNNRRVNHSVTNRIDINNTREAISTASYEKKIISDCTIRTHDTTGI